MSPAVMNTVSTGFGERATAPAMAEAMSAGSVTNGGV